MNDILRSILTEKSILPDLKTKDREGVFAEMVEYLVSHYKGLQGDVIFQRLLEREKISSTAVEHGIAFPHVRIPGLQDIVLAIGRSKSGIEFRSVDKHLTHIVVIFLAPEGRDYLHILARISKTLQNPKLREQLMTADSAPEIAALFSK